MHTLSSNLDQLPVTGVYLVISLLSDRELNKQSRGSRVESFHSLLLPPPPVSALLSAVRWPPLSVFE